MNSKILLITDLPDDCFFLIFQMIPNILEMIRLKLVCKRLNKVMNDYLSHFSLQFNKKCFQDNYFVSQNKNISIHLDKLFYNFPKLTKLDITFCKSFISDDISKVGFMNNLNEMIIDLSFLKASCDQLAFLFQKCPNLESLTLIEYQKIDNCLFNFNFNFLSNSVRKLKLIGLFSRNFKDLLKKKNFEINFLCINFDRISFANSEYDELISLIEKNLSNLKVLQLFIWDVPGSVYNLPKLKKLESLDICFNKKEVSIKPIKEMLKSMPDLRYFFLFFLDSPSINEILELCHRYCSNVEIIQNKNYIKDDYVTSKGLDFWKSLKNLRSVNGKSFQDWEHKRSETETFSFRKFKFNQTIL